VSLLLAGRAQQALDPLEAASRSPVRPLAEKARWYSTQANLWLGEGVRARHGGFFPWGSSAILF
jgi:hypothetical protein